MCKKKRKRDGYNLNYNMYKYIIYIYHSCLQNFRVHNSKKNKTVSKQQIGSLVKTIITNSKCGYSGLKIFPHLRVTVKHTRIHNTYNILLYYVFHQFLFAAEQYLRG